MSHAERTLRIISIAIFPALLVVFVAIFFNDPYQFFDILREDQWVEWLTFALLFLSGIVSLDLVVQVRQRAGYFHWFFIVFGIFCILAGLEEISWGQRVLAVESPEYFLSNSDQQEINLHNVLQQKLDFKTKDLAGVALFLYGFGLPLLGLNRRVQALFDRFKLVVPPLYLTPGFLIAALLMFDVPTKMEEEIGEFFFSLAFLLFMLAEVLHWGDGRAQPFALPTRLRITPLIERITLAALMVIGFGLRFWQTGVNDLWAREAKQALAGADASLALWPLIMRGWTGIFGQSDLALRILPALVSALAVAAIWYLMKRIWPDTFAERLIAALLLALSPALAFVGQETAGAGLVTLFVIVGFYATVGLLAAPDGWSALLFTVANVLAIALQPLAVIIFLIEALMLLAGIIHSSFVRRRWPLLVGASLLAALPTLWSMLNAGAVATSSPMTILLVIVTALYLLVVISAVRRTRAEIAVFWDWLLIAVTTVALGIVAMRPGALPGGAMALLLPVLISLITVCAAALWRNVRLLGVTMVIAVLLIPNYFDPYNKSDYELMASEVRASLGPADVVVIEGLRQYPLTRYYLPDAKLVSVPAMDLPTQWPYPELETPPIVPEDADDQVQALLREHPSIWLVMKDIVDVDEFHFLSSYMTAVSHKQDCTEWRDVEMCRFFSPHFAQLTANVPVDALYEDELHLGNAAIGVAATAPGEPRAILAQLDWTAPIVPDDDYKVSLRLVDADGQQISQQDDLPIGPLLPPTTWAQGDEKPGFMALTVPAATTPGEYTLLLNVYDPDRLRPLRYVRPGLEMTDTPVVLATVEITPEGEISLMP